jgi:hypothetical protein
MANQSVPLVILGGSDRRPAYMPPGGRSKHPLAGIKGVDVKIGGRPLIELVIERIRQVEAFDPIYVAGPGHAYRSLPDGISVDTDGGFGRNIQVGVETARRRHGDGPLAIVTCDIVPDPAEMKTVVRDFWSHSPLDFFFPMIKAPRDPERLGESGWKPQYHVKPEGASAPVPVLPGHLAMFDSAALRWKFIYRLMDLGYRTRNRPILYRNAYMARRLLWIMLVQDFIHLLNLRLPTFTWDTLLSGTRAARRLKEKVIQQSELELALRRMFIKRRHRRRHPDRKVRMPVVDAMSLARDIDTQEEAIAFGAVSA